MINFQDCVDKSIRGDLENQSIFSDTALVLLSSYNGSKFIIEQLSSLEKQKYVNLYVLIRDDGSVDDTFEKIRSFCDNHKNFACYQGENIGFIKSFDNLINHPITQYFNFVGFCDQDDVWLEDKVSTAIGFIEKQDQNLPVLYCGNLTVVNENLEKIRMMRNYTPSSSRYTPIVHSCATGCTEFFNHKAVEKYLLGEGAQKELHDFWMYLVCFYLGKVIYDKESHILYRQHQNNIVGSRKGNVAVVTNNIRTKHDHKREAMLSDFLKVYRGELKEADSVIIERLASCGGSIHNRLKIFLSPLYRGNTCGVTLNFKLRVLLNRLY